MDFITTKILKPEFVEKIRAIEADDEFKCCSTILELRKEIEQ